MVFRVLLLIGLLLLPVSARAQTWMVCIDPRSGGPTPEGFIAIREAVEARKNSRFGFLNYEVRHAVEGPSSHPLPVRTMVMEMMYAGIGQGSITVRSDLPYAGLPAGEETCFEIFAAEGPPGLWHYWGPYFDLGSAVIPEAWKASMEMLIPGYVPGQTIYRVYAHTDTVGSREENRRLSESRADAVARQLVRLGVRWDDIEQHPRGEDELARPTADGVAEPLNRRVFIDVRQRPTAAH